MPSLPLLKPPYGEVVAIDLNKGDIAWRVPIGDTPSIRSHPLLAGVTLPEQLGAPGAPGAIVTAGGVIFVGGGDTSLHALDKRNGKTLWRSDLGRLPRLDRLAGRPDQRGRVRLAVDPFDPRPHLVPAHGRHPPPAAAATQRVETRSSRAESGASRAGEHLAGPFAVPPDLRHQRLDRVEALLAPEPLDEPPLTCCAFHALRQSPKCSLCPVGLPANSDMLSVPSQIAPAACMRSATAAVTRGR